MPGGARTAKALCVALLCGACRHMAPPAVPGAGAAPGGFSHASAAHARQACTSCHAGRPGHDACTSCHPQLLAQVAKELPTARPCAACHERAPVRALPARFDHRLHTSRGKMEQAAGFHPACEDCHAPGGSFRQAATHEACARCHDTRAPQMADCLGCHGAGPPLETARHLIRGDLMFSHQAHERDRVGRAIGCPSCHDAVSSAATVYAVPAPETQRCTTCHDDRRITPPEVRMGRCGGCHLDATMAERGVLAPRSHQLGSIEPDDHTLAFRRDHAEAARSAGARCAQCHQGLSGSRRDSCQECHAVMRPRDHTLTFRQEDHGREAAVARERCASCHSADYCESCHSIPPRSHSPRSEWLYGHAQVARLGLRSCFGCHTFENTCAACHARGLR